MISEKSKQAYKRMLKERTLVGDWKTMDFPERRKRHTEEIEAISNLSGLLVTRKKFGGVPVEIIRFPDGRDDGYMLYIHGGAWTSGDPAWGHFCAVETARISGKTVVSADYRLAPEYPYPVAHEDCFHVYEGMLGEGIDADRIVMLGDSTGGNLVLTTLVRAKDKGLPMPAAACVVSAVADLSFSFPSYTERANRDCALYTNQGEIVQALYVRGADTKSPYMSPYYADFSGFPPVYIIVSSEEMLYDDSINLYEKMQEAGVDVSLTVWKDMWHAFYMEDYPESRQVFSDISGFFRDCTETKMR